MYMRKFFLLTFLVVFLVGGIGGVLAQEDSDVPVLDISLARIASVSFQTVGQDTQDVSLVAFDFRATGGDVGVSHFELEARARGTDERRTIGLVPTDILNLALYDTYEMDLPAAESLLQWPSGLHTVSFVEFDTLDFLIPEGERRTLLLRGDISASMDAGEYYFSVSAVSTYSPDSTVDNIIVPQVTGMSPSPNFDGVVSVQVVATPVLDISLSPGTSSQTVQPGAQGVPLIVFDFRATDGDVGVDYLKFRVGIPGALWRTTLNIMSIDDISNLALYEGNTILSDVVPLSFTVSSYGGSGSPFFEFGNLDFLIPEGEMRTLVLRGDISASMRVGEYYFSPSAINISPGSFITVTNGVIIPRLTGFIVGEIDDVIPLQIVAGGMEGASCPEDISGDGIINIRDLVLVATAFGAGAMPQDVNSDGTVNIIDLAMVGRRFGEVCGSAYNLEQPNSHRVVFVPVSKPESSTTAKFASVLKSIFWLVGND